MYNYGALSELPVAEIRIWPESKDNTVAMTEHIEKTAFTFAGHTFTPCGHVKHWSKYDADAISEASVQSVPWSRPQLHTKAWHGNTSTNHSAVLCAVERGVPGWQEETRSMYQNLMSSYNDLHSRCSHTCWLNSKKTNIENVFKNNGKRWQTRATWVRSWNKGNGPHPNAACHWHHIWQETGPAETNHMKPCSPSNERTKCTLFQGGNSQGFGCKVRTG